MSVDLVALLATLAVGLASYVMRSVFIVMLADREFSPRARQALAFVGPSVMAALVVSLLLGGEESADAAEVVALAVGGLVGWRTRSLPWVLVGGMATLLVVGAVI